MAHDGVALPHPDADQLHLASEERVHVGCRRQTEQPGDLQGGGVLGVDHCVDVQVPPEGGQIFGVGHVPDAGDGVLSTQTLGGEGAEHIDLVHVGGGQNQVGFLRPGLSEDRGGGTGAFDTHNVQGVVDCLDDLLVVVDDGDVVVLLGEEGSQGGAHFAGPHNDNVQSASAFPQAGQIPPN